MKRTLAILLLMPLVPVAGTLAATFDRLPIAPEQGIDGFNRSVARATLSRELFGAVGAGVAFTRTDVYDRFPYTESRTFQVVTDPAWNRVLAGDTQHGFAAFTGADTEMGPLSEPRGVALGGDDRLYVCDTGHNRVVMLRIVTEYDALRLEAAGAIDGLSRPWGVAWSDAGTPDDSADDRLYVTEAGANAVSLVTLGAVPRVAATLGGLGSGVGRFAGPLAIAVGRLDGRMTDDVYVADAHNRRIVRLKDRQGRLDWASEAATPFSQVSALDCDDAGNLYVTGPREKSVARLSPALETLMTLTARDLAATGAAEGAAPRDFKLVRAEVVDHRTGGVTHPAVARAVLLSDWSDTRGVTLWRLGLEARDARVDAQRRVSVLLTDRATLDVELVDAAQVVAVRHAFGPQAAGRRTLDLAGAGLFDGLPAGEYRARLSARPLAGDAAPSVAEVALTLDGAAGQLGGQKPALLGNTPNPFAATTVIRVRVPAAFAAGGTGAGGGAAATARLELFDTTGRLVRGFERSVPAAGLLDLPWDGRDDAGRSVPSGLYFYRVRLAGETLRGQLVVVR